MKKLRLIALMVCAIAFSACVQESVEGVSHNIDIQSRAQLHEWFRYSPQRPVVISGHRGGMMTGFPENCIESFENTLSMMPAFFEIDPRFTKDSVIVLMHDETIDRTTTGTGKLSDYTYEELQQFSLVDREGNVTGFKIPKLEDCIAWSQGKTILNLDIKDVPLEIITDLINSINPPNVIYTVWNAEQARFVLDKDPDAGFSLWCKNMREFIQYDRAGVPWGQTMAYVGDFMRENQQVLYDSLHERGVMCMISTAPTHDGRMTDGEKVMGYKLELASSCDVIETDYPYLFRGLNLKRE